VIACRDAVSDPWELARAIRASLEELVKAVATAPPAVGAGEGAP
jgi:hypothetical protein